jgi:small-conductance mechanosensitive channel
MDNKQVSAEELQEIKDLRVQLENLTQKLGQLSLQKFELNELENELNKELKVLRENEIKLGGKLTEKYGDGTVNIETGEFTTAS